MGIGYDALKVIEIIMIELLFLNVPKSRGSHCLTVHCERYDIQSVKFGISIQIYCDLFDSFLMIISPQITSILIQKAKSRLF